MRPPGIDPAVPVAGAMNLLVASSADIPGMLPPMAPGLLTIWGLLHFGILVVLSLPGHTRPITPGDAAFLIGFGAVCLIAARAMTRGRRWGRWLGMAASGIEAVPAAVLLYVMLVYSADPGRRLSLAQLGFMALLLAPLIVLVIVWRHRDLPGGARIG